MSIAAIPQLPVQRPGLAFQYAFDWLAQHLHAANGPTACIIDQPMAEVEMVSRIPSLPILPKDSFAASSSLSLPALGWILPRRRGPDSLGSLRPWLDMGGTLHIIAAGPLVSFLSEQQGNGRYISTGQILRSSPLQGWRVRERFGLHGIHGVMWQLLATAVGKLGQASMHDRFHFAMRRSFVEQGLCRSFVALSCITLERTK